MMYIKDLDWSPSDNLVLEDNAMITVKSDYNTLIIAGPGAGKTELLAQRASFLLETNSCPYPRKILAISFKRDAAFNLGSRVEKRCNDRLAKRFDSYTFDAFAKLILDQFYRGLPSEYEIKFPYDIFFDRREILDLYEAISPESYYAHTQDDVIRLHNRKLPIDIIKDFDEVVFNVWEELIKNKRTRLSFNMIMRLAQLIIETNPKIKNYLQSTYSHVFLDEFQDTTFLQFDFLNSCFERSNSILTAVGDDKQRIMLWAGARPDIFNKYIQNYSAQCLSLKMNFRSAPRLVALQNHLISELLDKDDFITSSSKWDENEGQAFLWFYSDQQKETEHLFKVVKKWINEDNISPRDICILVKQQLSVYTGVLIDYFNKNGIKARDESQLQDLLSDDLILFILNTIILIFNNKKLESKIQTSKILINIFSVVNDDDILKIEQEYFKFLKKIKIKVERELININEIVEQIISYISIDKIKAHYPNYRNESYYRNNILQLCNFLNSYYEDNTNIIDAVENLIGKDSVPVMTIHKSKGLEYRSMIFVGLEDDAFWSFENQPDEDKCAFFVALSRAKEKVVFTFCKNRINKWGNSKSQNNSKIRIIFQKLEESNIVEFKEITD